MKKHVRVHRRVTPSPTLSNSPENVQASQMRDRLTVAREQLDDPSLLSRGVLSFHHDDHERDPLRLAQVEDQRRTILHDTEKTISKNRHFLVTGAPAEHGYRSRPTRVQSDSRLFWMPEQMRDEFRFPRQTIVCIRRQARRRVLFALRQIGKGAGGKKFRPAKWSESSRIVCRRR